MKKLKLIALSAILSLGSLPIFGQITDIKDLEPILDHIGGSVELRTMHLWRGIQVSDEFTMVTDMHFKTKNNAFKAGLWGGAGIDGGFKEFDYYASYEKNGLSFAVWDIYNFSDGVGHERKKAFNYCAGETNHFIDVSAAYQFQKSIPLKIYWATVVFGRDRGYKEGENLAGKNRYSTFLKLSYPVIDISGFRLDASIAGAFALDKGKDEAGKTTKANFYGKTAGIVDIQLVLQKDLMISGYKLPVYMMPMWNPQDNYMNMQFGVTFFSF